MRRNLYLVEGNMDVSRLKSLNCRFVYITNGYGSKRDVYEFLKKAEKVRKIILLLDPDKNGKMIRERMKNTLSNYESVEIPYSLAKGKRKLGVAETKRDVLLDLLGKYLEQDNTSDERDSLSADELKELHLLGDNSQVNKELLNSVLNVRIGTSKSLLNDLNILNMNKEEVRGVLENGKDIR